MFTDATSPSDGFVRKRDPFASVDPRWVSRLSIGRPSDGLPISEPCRPTLRSPTSTISETLSDATHNDAIFNRAIPIPTGVEFVTNTSHNQLPLIIDESFARRYRMVSGSISEILLTVDGQGAASGPCFSPLLSPHSLFRFAFTQGFPPTPGRLHVLVTLNWRFGDSVTETKASFIHVRAVAFVSKCFCDKPAVCAKVGGAVSGFIAPSNDDPRSSHLVGRDLASAETWRAVAPNTFPPHQWGLNSDLSVGTPLFSVTLFHSFGFSAPKAISGAIYMPPHLPRTHFAHGSPPPVRITPI